MAEGRKKKAPQLCCEHRLIFIHLGRVKCEKCGLEGEFKPLALLPPLAGSGNSMERKIPNVLRRPAPEGSPWPLSRKERRKDVARARGNKTKSSCRKIRRDL